MFRLFKKKTDLEKLQSKYKGLLKEAHELSTVDRTASDRKTAEANGVLDQIVLLENKLKTP